MSSQSEFKKKYNPETGKFIRQHIYGEGVITDAFRSVGKLMGNKVKSAASKSVKKAATKTGEHVGKKAGDKIVSMLSKEKTPKKQPSKNVEIFPKKYSQQQRNARVNSILTGGKII